MSQRIEKKLQELLNRQVQYGNKVLVINGYDIDEVKERVYIHTNEKQNHFDRPFDSAYAFLREFTITEMALTTKEKQTNSFMSTTDSMADQVQEILLSNIKKIQEDAGFIPQAKAITNNVNSLINLNKLKLTAYIASKKANN